MIPDRPDRPVAVTNSDLLRGRVDVSVGGERSRSSLTLTRGEALALWRALGAYLQTPGARS